MFHFNADFRVLGMPAQSEPTAAGKHRKTLPDEIGLICKARVRLKIKDQRQENRGHL